VSGEAITARGNARMEMLLHPEREIEVLPAAEVVFGDRQEMG
jgi:hypothetical protein